MGKKIAFIGAGSFGFTRGLVSDILTYPAFSDLTIYMSDINKERLAMIKKAVEKLVTASGKPVKVEATTSRKEALLGADGVLCTILSGAVDVWRYDIEIPKKYGVDINVGDTRSVSGIFRALRTVPVMLDICKDIERYCPNAVFLNYTNPMAMLCRAMQGQTKVNVTGLCHSVQGTVMQLGWIMDKKEQDFDYICAGINHQAWYFKLNYQGKDVYPELRKKLLTDKKAYQKDVVRNEMFLQLGYYVTESSGHGSEYNAWFRKRPDLIKKYCRKYPHSHWNPGEYAFILKYYLKMEKEKGYITEMKKWMEQPAKITKASHEYASNIFNAIFGDNKLFKFNGNVRNFNLIDNLPYGACVEVPVVASRMGLEPTHIGALPPQLALLNSISCQVEELAVAAAIEGNPDKAFWACAYDPLCSAVLSLQEIKDMVNDLFKANKNYLPQFKHKKVN